MTSHLRTLLQGGKEIHVNTEGVFVYFGSVFNFLAGNGVGSSITHKKENHQENKQAHFLIHAAEKVIK